MLGDEQSIVGMQKNRALGMYTDPGVGGCRNCALQGSLYELLGTKWLLGQQSWLETESSFLPWVLQQQGHLTQPHASMPIWQEGSKSQNVRAQSWDKGEWTEDAYPLPSQIANSVYQQTCTDWAQHLCKTSPQISSTQGKEKAIFYSNPWTMRKPFQVIILNNMHTSIC